MDDISSMEEEVSSMEAACWEAPSAMDWLEEETSADAAVTWLAPSSNPAIIRLTGAVILRVMKNAIRHPMMSAAIKPKTIIMDALPRELTAPLAISLVATIPASAVVLQAVRTFWPTSDRLAAMA